MMSSTRKCDSRFVLHEGYSRADTSKRFARLARGVSVQHDSLGMTHGTLVSFLGWRVMAHDYWRGQGVRCAHAAGSRCMLGPD